MDNLKYLSVINVTPMYLISSACGKLAPSDNSEAQATARHFPILITMDFLMLNLRSSSADSTVHI